MKKKIIFGSVIAVIILLMAPVVPAIHLHSFTDSNKSLIADQIQNICCNEMKKGYSQILNVNYVGPLMRLLINLIDNLLSLSNKWWLIKGKDGPQPPLSKFLFSMSQFLTLIALIIGFTLFRWEIEPQPHY